MRGFIAQRPLHRNVRGCGCLADHWFVLVVDD